MIIFSASKQLWHNLYGDIFGASRKWLLCYAIFSENLRFQKKESYSSINKLHSEWNCSSLFCQNWTWLFPLLEHNCPIGEWPFASNFWFHTWFSVRFSLNVRLVVPLKQIQIWWLGLFQVSFNCTTFPREQCEWHSAISDSHWYF